MKFRAKLPPKTGVTRQIRAVEPFEDLLLEPILRHSSGSFLFFPAAEADGLELFAGKEVIELQRFGSAGLVAAAGS